MRMKQYKDDLLVSCLQLLLSLPNELVEPEFPNLVPALQVRNNPTKYFCIDLLLSYPDYLQAGTQLPPIGTSRPSSSSGLELSVTSISGQPTLSWHTASS